MRPCRFDKFTTSPTGAGTTSRAFQAAVRQVRLGARAVLGSSIAYRLVRAVGSDRVAVFMMHRFAPRGAAYHGADPDDLRATLDGLRRRGVGLLSVADLARHVADREPLAGPAAVFTVDDGYADFDTVAAPIFAEFDCPVTVFLVSRFVDGDIWCWWDRIAVAFESTSRRDVTLEIDGAPASFALGDLAARRAAAARCAELLKRVPDTVRGELVARIGREVDVDLPARPPAAFAAMSWDDVRRLERQGVTFGPHTRNHPTLATVDDTVARDEILGSWADVQRECLSPLPVFCYPNGTFDSYGARDMEIVAGAGLRCAFAVYGGYVDQRSAGESRFRLPRFPYDDWPTTAYQASGLARVLPPALAALDEVRRRR